MTEQVGKCQSTRRASYLAAHSLIILCPNLLLVLALLLTACGPASSSFEGPRVRTALPTPTLESTFTPSPLPTSTRQPLPTATPAEPTPTLISQSVLSGLILAKDTNQPIAGAKVSAGIRTDTTDAEGRYTLADLPPGQFALSVTRDGYDPALSAIVTLTAGQSLSLDLTLYAKDASPYPQDPMLTNPLDPAGAPTAKDAERLARLQGLTGEVTKVEETKLHGEYLVNYKRGGEVRAAVAKLDHDAWVLTDTVGQTWWIIKVCGNLARLVPTEVAIATPQPRSLPPLAEVLAEGVSVRACASEACAEVSMLPQGKQVEVFGCLANGGWCQVGLPGAKKGWCTGKSLRQLAVASVVPLVEAILPTATPGSLAREGKIAFVSTQHSTNADMWQAPTDIYIMNSDGSKQRRLNIPMSSHEPIAYFAYLKWLSQKEIVFGVPRANYIYDLESSRLSSWDVSYSLFDASDSAHRIAYIPRGTSTDIFVANADGSNPIKVTDASIRTSVFGQDWESFGLAISPDGGKIIFAGGQDIGVVNADGSGAKVLVKVKEIGLSDHFDWSSDGQRIVFESAGSGSGPRGVLRVNADGSDLRLLFKATDMSMPVWSPDGQKIAFVHQYQIYVMDAGGQNVTQLTNDGFNCCPAWSH